MAKTHDFGKDSETRVKKLLITQGYTFVTQNYRCPFGEIDSIYQKNGQLYFVEVKARKSGQFGSALEAVTRFKLNKIKKTAAHFFNQHPNFPQSGVILVATIDTGSDSITTTIVED
jgi:putative endonuclease